MPCCLMYKVSFSPKECSRVGLTLENIRSMALTVQGGKLRQGGWLWAQLWFLLSPKPCTIAPHQPPPLVLPPHARPEKRLHPEQSHVLNIWRLLLCCSGCCLAQESSNVDLQTFLVFWSDAAFPDPAPFLPSCGRLACPGPQSRSLGWRRDPWMCVCACGRVFQGARLREQPLAPSEQDWSPPPRPPQPGH